MNIWEHTCGRCHPDRRASRLPQAPTHPGWEDPEAITSASHVIDLDQASRGMQGTEESELSDPVADEDPVADIDEREYGEGHRTAAVEAIRRSGTEAIAFYAPIHFYGHKHWGIYIHERNFFGACAEAAALLASSAWDDVVADMLRAMMRHECFHAAVEFFNLVLEDLACLGADKLLRSNCPYDAYFHNEYQRTWPTHECLEERIATAHQFSARFRTHGFRRVMAKMLESAPPAYAGWKVYGKRDAIDKGIQRLAFKIISGSYKLQAARKVLTAFQYRAVWFPQTDPRSLDSKGPVPRWVYHSDGVRPSRFARAVHGNVRLKRLLNALERIYNAQVGRGGKHSAIRFPNGKKVPFSATRTVPPYLIGDIARALGVTRKEVLSKCLGVHV